MPCSITAIECHLPERVVTNSELATQFPGWDIDKAEKKVGIYQRHVAGANETSLDLGEQAALKVLKKNGTKVDFLLFCTETPDYFIPPNACLLQERLGLGTDIGAYDFNLGCSGFVFGLAQAKGLISAGLAERVLLVTAETYTRAINPQDKGNRMIFGDAAAACIVEKTEQAGIGDFVFGTDGSMGKSLLIPNGGFRNPQEQGADLVKDDNGNARTENDLYMNGPSIFAFTLERVPKLYEDILAKNNTQFSELDLVLFHQANRFMLNHLRLRMQIPPEKFVMDMEYTGNTVSSSIPIALKKIMDTANSPTSVLLAGFGVGLSWAGTIVTVGR